MKLKPLKVFLLVLLLTVVFCLIATTFKIFTVGDLPLNFVAVLLEAVVTAIITVVLLNGQSAAEEVKERNVKVFEKKSEIFQNYIDIIWDIWVDHKVTSEEYLQLTSLYYKKLMLYLNKNSLKIIGEKLSTIGKLIDNKNKSEKEAELQDCLISIINVLSDEISLGGHIDLDLFKDLDQKMEVARTRRQNRSFKTLNIKIGTELVFKNDTNIRCKTLDEKNLVEYEGRKYSISGLSNELTKSTTNGFSYFMFDGNILSEMD